MDFEKEMNAAMYNWFKSNAGQNFIESLKREIKAEVMTELTEKGIIQPQQSQYAQMFVGGPTVSEPTPSYIDKAKEALDSKVEFEAEQYDEYSGMYTGSVSDAFEPDYSGIEQAHNEAIKPSFELLYEFQSPVSPEIEAEIEKINNDDFSL